MGRSREHLLLPHARSKNKTRPTILSAAFINRLEQIRVESSHCIYHHFTDGGTSEDLDIILYGDHESAPDAVVEIVCELEHSLMSSHHDIVSTCSLPPHLQEISDQTSNVAAPRIPNIFSTKWSDE